MRPEKRDGDFAAGGIFLTWEFFCDSFAPLGRMSFTNYILQSLIFSWIFFGYGFGQFNRMNVTTAFLLGVVVYIAQMIGSALWLRWFRFGPLEWLWRSLMYGKAQVMLKPRLRSVELAH